MSSNLTGLICIIYIIHLLYDKLPGFTYVAVDKRGKEKRGSIEADNKEKVIDILKNDGLIPVSVLK